MIWTLDSVDTPHWSVAFAVIVGWEESNWPVLRIATIDSPVPRAPSLLEDHWTVTSSPFGSETMAERDTAAPKRCVLGSRTAMWEDRFAGEIFSAVGGSLSGGIASVVVVVVNRVVVVGRVVVVVDDVVVDGRVVDVVVVEAALVSSVVVVDWVDPAATVPVGSFVVESVSSAAGEHAATSSRVARPSAAIRTELRRLRDTPTASPRACRRPGRRTSRSSAAAVRSWLVLASIP